MYKSRENITQHIKGKIVIDSHYISFCPDTENLPTLVF